MHETRSVVVVAGANGDLGSRVARYLVRQGSIVHALVRGNSDLSRINDLVGNGLYIKQVDYKDVQSVTQACRGAQVVISTLSGVREVIVDAQTVLLNAAVNAGVPRFIPSDFAIDFTKLKPGSNRNLDFRREFKKRLDSAPIRPTSIFNGMFTDLLQGTAPVILYGMKRVMYYGDADQKMDFTTIDNTAEYTAYAALDPNTPRNLHISGEESSSRDLKQLASELSSEEYKFLRPGGLGLLKVFIKVTRTFSPAKKEVFPAWQGMQYLHNMLGGKAKFKKLDNARYPVEWTPIKEVIKEQFKK